MKLAKLSLAAIVVAGLSTSSFAADTLSDAFKNGKVSGALKAYYFDRDDGTTSEDIVNFGLMLNYKTDTFNGFGLNFTGQTSHAPFANGAVGVNGSKDMFSDDEYGSGAVLSEAYISYTMKNTTVLVGRMFLDTPLVASSGSRMVKQAFEGAAFINTDLPNTTLIAGYVQKFQGRTDGDGNIGNFSRTIGTGSGMPEITLDTLSLDTALIFDKGAYTVAAINKSVSGLTLTGAYAQADDVYSVGLDASIDIKLAYAEAAYEGKVNNFTYGLAAQYYYNKLGGDNGTIEANNLWGVKASVGYDAFGIYAAYSKVNEKDNGLGVIPGLGGGADLAYTASPINSSSYWNGSKAYKVGATYAVVKNANIGLSYTVNDVPENLLTGEDAFKASFVGVEADYAFEGALKGLSLSVIFEDQGKDANGNEMWAKANYKF